MIKLGAFNLPYIRKNTRFAKRVFSRIIIETFQGLAFTKADRCKSGISNDEPMQKRLFFLIINNLKTR